MRGSHERRSSPESTTLIRRAKSFALAPTVLFTLPASRHRSIYSSSRQDQNILVFFSLLTDPYVDCLVKLAKPTHLWR